MQRDFLPGVRVAAIPPSVACDARASIARARRVAIMRDVLEVVALIAVDYLFVSFPSTHIPFLDRADSISLMRLLNMLVFAQILVARSLPRWRARRIATTWCASEQKRFLGKRR